MEVQGWTTPPLLEDLENFLANQKTLAKLLANVSLKNEEHVLYNNKEGVIQKIRDPLIMRREDLEG